MRSVNKVFQYFLYERWQQRPLVLKIRIKISFSTLHKAMTQLLNT
jgi:ribosomal protein L16 Arg81 hydroxylase